jgi:hypothetical protein
MIFGPRCYTAQAQWKVVLKSSGYSKCPGRTNGATNANGGDPTLLLLVRQDDPGQVLLSPWSGFSFAHGWPAVLMLDKTGLLCWNEIGWLPGLPEYTRLVPKVPAPGLGLFFHYTQGTVAHGGSRW